MIKVFAETFKCSRLNTLCLDYVVDAPLLLSKEQSSKREERHTNKELEVESKDSAFQRHGAHPFISPLTTDVYVNENLFNLYSS